MMRGRCCMCISLIFRSINENRLSSIVGVLFMTGALFVAFSREKTEDEFIAKIRLESLLWATYINYGVLLFCFLFFSSMRLSLSM